jgi:Mrp family chromosome partitioning ATPase
MLAEIHRGEKGAAGPLGHRRDTSRKELPAGRSLAEVTRFRPEGATGTAGRLGALPSAISVASTSTAVSALARKMADPGEDVAGGKPSVATIGGAGRVRVHEMVGAADPDPSMIMLTAPDSMAAAEFRILRHRIADRGSPRVVLVTSPRSGEGKSWCAANLALAMAEGDRGHVLLLEANFRSPSVSSLLGIQPPISLEKQLEFYRAMRLHSWDVAETASPRLHAMTMASDVEDAPALDGPSLAVCVADLGSAGYDRMIVDGPSILGSADANVVEENVDSILIVLHVGTSRLRDLRKAIEQIGAPKVLGVVLVRT